MLAIMPVLNQQNLFSNTVALAQGYDAGYYGDSSYSKYPTDENKYECRTGPFEGFFVSSVVFCKHVKFDDKDRKDNRDSGTGPQGPAGPQGIQGIPGPGGITQLNSSNVYQEISNVTSIPNNTGVGVLVSCDPEDKVINGGYNLEVSDPFFSNINVFQNQPVGGDPSKGWFVEIVYSNATGTTAQMTVIANCFDNPPLSLFYQYQYYEEISIVHLHFLCLQIYLEIDIPYYYFHQK